MSTTSYVPNVSLLPRNVSRAPESPFKKSFLLRAKVRTVASASATAALSVSHKDTRNRDLRKETEDAACLRNATTKRPSPQKGSIIRTSYPLEFGAAPMIEAASCWASNSGV